MTTAPPNAHAPDEPWKTFAASASEWSPDATITRMAFAATMAPSHGASALDEAAAPPPVTLPELPHLAMASPGSQSADAAGADFEITGVLGEGGMGRVLLARQQSLRRDVAIKIVKAASASRQVVDTLLAEAVVTGSIEHPSVVPVHALGRDTEGRPILVMKRIEGVSWRDLTRDAGHPAWASIAADEGDRLDAHLDILMAVCNAAHCAHSRGVVHRDLKLDNVMIGAFGEVYVVDWGIAIRAAKPGELGVKDGALIGTPAYMSPEMVKGDGSRIDARTDVYLLGATLHAVLTGAPRHRGESLLEVLLSARDSLPFEYDASIPTELAAICNRAMSADPDDRFSTALDLRCALTSFRRHRGSIALSDQAAALLVEIHAAAHETAATRPDGAAPGNERRMTECRFGFTQALRAWKENAAARAGLQACLEAMIQHEIEQRDAEGARALYAELGDARPDLFRRIEALSAELRASADREARLQAMERDLDLSIGARAQLLIVGIVPIFAMMMAGVVYWGNERAPSRRAVIVSPSIVFGLVLIGIFFGHRRLRTAISRRALGVLVLMLGAVLLHRIVATAEGMALAPLFAGDLLIGAMAGGALGITLMPRMGWVPLPSIAGAIAITIWPALALPIFAVSMTSSSILLLLFWRRSARS